MNIIYYCTGCNNKTADSSSLIKSKGGCRSCGKSGYKCPKCGMIMKAHKFSTNPNNPPMQNPAIETGVKLNLNGTAEKSIRNLKIRRIK